MVEYFLFFMIVCVVYDLWCYGLWYYDRIVVVGDYEVVWYV